jgi:hypothetical protein
VNHNYRADGHYKTSLIDAGERRLFKAWRAIGVSFATPEDRGNLASTDVTNLTVSYSVDGGTTFTNLINASPAIPADRTLELGQGIPGRDGR